MKNRIALIIILIMLFATASAYGQEKFKPGSEPDGFRGIKWGTDIKKIKEVKGLEFNGVQKNIDIYKIKRDDLMIGDAQLSNLGYGFWQGGFMKVDIVVHDIKNYEKLKKVVFDTFGEAKKTKLDDGTDRYAWEGEKSTMFLSTFDKIGLMIIMSKDIQREAEQYIKQKATQGADKGF
ncbi:MAG: hypothetical protein KKI12_10300 [Proteobacteria bacterium]|nr:hypothetical protein [Pseudomonadota bacterium]MBU4257777.1 hypothetical protein [Pseudomonadota bacterium]MBU4288547.1 hypothetical protein [Pseudomonadota bacterium]MBU4414881.1 hypothetical protein [Pseudomonadota bacterium]MCG2759512.1 hypothetical protein [Desulfobacteraceae bacterium]